MVPSSRPAASDTPRWRPPILLPELEAEAGQSSRQRFDHRRRCHSRSDAYGDRRLDRHHDPFGAKDQDRRYHDGPSTGPDSVVNDCRCHGLSLSTEFEPAARATGPALVDATASHSLFTKPARASGSSSRLRGNLRALSAPMRSEGDNRLNRCRCPVDGDGPSQEHGPHGKESWPWHRRRRTSSQFCCAI
jgi:hypothetical protein